MPTGCHGLRRRQLERHRDRLHLRRPRHLQEVQGAGARRRLCRCSRLDIRAFDPRRSSPTAGGSRASRAPPATCAIQVPPLTTRPKAATVGVGRQVILRPSVVRSATSADRADAGRPAHRHRAACSTRSTTSTENVDPHVLRDLPRVAAGRRLRRHRRRRRRRCSSASSRATPRDRVYGIAFDLGTTTVVATLLDLATGTPDRRRLDAQQAAAVRRRRDQPDQRHDARPGRARASCSSLAHETLAELAAEVCAEAGVDPAEVYEVALAGNATMTQIALGIDPEPLGVAPFILATERYPTLLRQRARLRRSTRAPGRFFFPALGAYVGGDIIAGALATGMDRDKRLRLFIDIGTNCEIVLGDGERLLATAAPAGPAFEAASIRCGMRAAAGAIEVVTIDDDGVHLQVIGDVEPVGLCGSGPRRRRRRARPRRAARRESAGSSRRGGRAERLPGAGAAGWARSTASASSSCAAPDAGARRRSSCRSATCASCSSPRRPSRPAGGCCSRSSASTRATSSRCCSPARSARTCRPPARFAIGLVPKLPVLRIVSAGNVAGEGAKMVAAVGAGAAWRAALLEEIEYLELSDRADFNDRFVDQLAFPYADAGRRRRHRVRRARAPTSRAICAAPRLAGRDPPAAAAAAQPPGADRARGRGARWTSWRRGTTALAVGYADCGTLRRTRRGVRSAAESRGCGGAHCYDVFAGAERDRRALFADRAGHVLSSPTSWCGLRALGGRELGLDRHPELRDDYFGHYTRVVWLAQRRTPDLERGRRAGRRGALGLPLRCCRYPPRTGWSADRSRHLLAAPAPPSLSAQAWPLPAAPRGQRLRTQRRPRTDVQVCDN